ncbi:MAG: glycosyltransferase family 2 protein, partial [Pirellulales bacterium]
WGVEDLDFSLKCWLMGYPILHDPEAVIGHRFQESFSSYRVSAVQILVSQMRMAYKNLSLSTWPEWLRMCRERYADSFSELPEGFYSAAWHQFENGRATVERERIYLYARRTRDDLWYAEYFGLPWPRLGAAAPIATLAPFRRSKPHTEPDVQRHPYDLRQWIRSSRYGPRFHLLWNEYLARCHHDRRRLPCWQTGLVIRTTTGRVDYRPAGGGYEPRDDRAGRGRRVRYPGRL